VPSERPVQLVLTRGSAGYGSGGPLEDADHQEPYLRKILHFIGLTDVRSIVAEGTAYGPQVAEPVLAEALVQARAAAREFGRRSSPSPVPAATPA
jgi:FMN-dependent NADH-azoreductase